MRYTRKLAKKVLAAAAASAVIVIAVAGCGKPGSGAASSGLAPAKGSPAVSAAQKSLAALYKGTSTSPPDSGPRAVAGKSVWVIPCGQISAACSAIAEGSVAAAHTLGWQAKTCDGALDKNNGWTTCIQEALAARASGIVTVAIDCAAVKPALKQATAAKVPVVNAGGFDCDENLPSGAGRGLFSASTTGALPYPTNTSWWTAMGSAEADYLIAKLGARANALSMDFTSVTSGLLNNRAFSRSFASCSSCTFTQVPMTSTQEDTADITTLLQSALLRHPGAQGLEAFSDSLVSLGLARAVKATGKPMTVISTGGTANTFSLIRANAGLSATVAYDDGWIGYAAADTLNRLFAGQKPVSEGYGLQLVDSSHNLPAAGQPYQAGVNYRDAYAKVWDGR